mmetsp:Transcript_9598/g.18677  ORF Transcript_9598/g.18677 Transcript_9598/m.18677 type:complete len:85 (-) Transcript_9598:1247-1501(-)
MASRVASLMPRVSVLPPTSHQKDDRLPWAINLASLSLFLFLPLSFILFNSVKKSACRQTRYFLLSSVTASTDAPVLYTSLSIPS